ncbi:MAG: hypothetical protein ACQSGP_32220 [Frankia sp.]
MIFFIVLGGTVLLVGSALIWGTDSRDGRDWAPGRADHTGGTVVAAEPYPADAAGPGRNTPFPGLSAHHEG